MSDIEPGSNEPAAASAPDMAAPAGFLSQLRLAFSFLTILPVLDAGQAPGETVAASFGWFALVGFLLGLALCGADAILAYWLSQAIRSAILILSLTIVSGGIHLDGLADTADALGAGSNRERALEILSDSRIGTYGAVAIFFDLALKTLALATLAGPHRYAALIVAPMLARGAMPLVAHRLEYLRNGGAGAALLAHHDRAAGHVLAMAILMVVVSVALGETKALIVAGVVTYATREFYRRWLGGVTGDLIGACGELVEVAVLISIAS
ncbi:MAG TPA: adenosylcobinamide-GDP ribazoletransferase [Candidatus Acidoferrales bacterium]|nr:adenosylcobinamide-GDP ribazoletransferase [Candidatus Acidoferrales bacterium]